jgi:hypothetical protein
MVHLIRATMFLAIFIEKKCCLANAFKTSTTPFSKDWPWFRYIVRTIHLNQGQSLLYIIGYDGSLGASVSYHDWIQQLRESDKT